tara:strand:+ start:296 stop:523 length:228 start_codon:yes stop_codon:yes gene_type:complete
MTDRQKALKKQNSKLKKQNYELKKQNSELKKQNSELKKQLKKCERQLYALLSVSKNTSVGDELYGAIREMFDQRE